MVRLMVRKDDEVLTKDEARVLTLLQEDAKKSIDEIAKKCGCSRQKVWRIIKQLEAKHIIWGYTTVADGHARNLKHFLVLVKRNSVPLDPSIHKEMIEKRIDDNPAGLVKVESIYYTHGTYDFVIIFFAPDIIMAKKFVDHTFERLNKFLESYTILETLVPIRKMGMKNPLIKDMVDYI
jgi:DNA-binding Lrp family transcriptional regulator